TYSVSMIAGPAVGGLIIAHFGLLNAYIVDFITFLISLIALSLIKNISKPIVTRAESVLSSLMQGIRYALSKQELLGTYFVDFIAMVFGMPMALFPAIAHAYGDVKVLGMLYSAPAVGALFISFISGWTKRVKRHGLAISIAAIFWGVSI